MKKNESEMNRILVEVYCNRALAERTCQKWFKRFESDNFNLEDGEQVGPSKE